GAKRAGVTPEQIEALTFYERSPHFDEKDKVVLLYTERMTRAAGAGLRDVAVGGVKRHFTGDQIGELGLGLCLASFTNRFNNGLRLQPELGSPFPPLSTTAVGGPAAEDSPPATSRARRALEGTGRCGRSRHDRAAPRSG